MTTMRNEELAIIAELRAILAERLTTAPAACEQHGHGEGFHTAQAPDVVVFPQSTEEVSAIVAACAHHAVAVIPFGAGTSLEGHVAATEGGVCIDMSRMDQVLAVHAEDMDVTVQAGVRRKQLNSYLRDTGLFFSVDPGADATLGGMAATGASGTNTVRYGTIRENVLALTAVLADGRVVHTGGRARKSSAGYDLTRLLLGSEGTLAVITELTVRLHGNPESVTAAVCAFNQLDDAVQATMQMIQMGVPLARIEFLDDVSVQAVNAYSDLHYRQAPTLFFEFHGSEAGTAADAAVIEEIAADFGGRDFQWASDESERRRLWQARHDFFYAALAQVPGTRAVITDVCVPISRLAASIATTRAEIDATGLHAFIIGHVGDGNYHVLICTDPDNAEQMRTAEQLNAKIVAHALSMDGTCTGEHGVGVGKMKFMPREHGDALEVMRAVKLALDPDKRMNPGKIIQV